MSYKDLTDFVPFPTLTEPKERFDIEYLLFRGTQSEIYKGIDKENDNASVAIKVVENIPEYIDPIEEEYRTLKELSDHPNYPRFYGSFLVKDGEPRHHQIWFVMEYIAGGSIADLSRCLRGKNCRLSESVISYVLREVINAIIHLHAQHIMNRDIKGDNILITEDGRVKLVDFAHCRHLSSTMDRRNTSIGTPHWMAPEVIECGQKLDLDYNSCCDVWALGISAIELADGYPPLNNLHPMRVMLHVVRNPPPSFRKISEWSQDFADFVSECLVKNPEHRPFISELSEHPFIKFVPDDPKTIQEELVQLLKENNLMFNFEEKQKDSTQVIAYMGQLKFDLTSSSVQMITDDLASLEVFASETVLDTLHGRWKRSNYYTWLADILISINPLRDLPIYDEETQKNYISRIRTDNDPHIFAVADKAHQDMMHNREHQSIILTGESGSGKTYNFGMLVNHLCILGLSNPGLMEKIKMFPIILDAFGNAVTELNLNATRHCRYVDLTFSSTGKLSGAIVWMLMLEKLRVTKRPENEGNFHIFYYLYDGLSQSSRLTQYGLSAERKYDYLPKHPYVNEVMNAKNFEKVEEAFRVIGFEESQIETILSTLSAILILGNLKFSGQAKAQISDKEGLSEVSRLLNIQEKNLNWALCNSYRVRQGKSFEPYPTNEPYSKTKEEAAAGRDAFAQALYMRLVDFVVNTINENLAVTRLVFGDPYAIGIMDMFGFEANEINSLQNLMVNLANEQVQYYYNQFMFQWEMQDYEKEGIPVKNFSFPDNRHILELFLGRGCGILSLLEEESRKGDGSDVNFIEKLSKMPFSLIQKASDSCFSITHFVGRLRYEVAGFVQTNRYEISTELVQMMRLSENEFLRKMFTLQLTKGGNLVTEWSGQGEEIKNISYKKRNLKGSRRFNTKSKGKLSQTRHVQTACSTFRYSLIELLHKLTKSAPHFVRCILPNVDSSPSIFDQEMVKHQIKYHAICDTIRIRQQGFSHRIPYEEFLRRYQFLAFDFDEKVDVSKENARLLLLRLKMEGWAIGESKVFLKYYNEEYLSRLYETSVKKVIKIQSMMRTFMIVKRRKKGKLGPRNTSSKKSSRKSVSYKADKDEAATRIQAHYRGYCVRKNPEYNLTHKLHKSQDAESTEAKSARLVQYYFRKWKMKTLFQALQMYRADKQQQLVFFSQQVHLYGQEVQAKLQRRNMLLDLKNIEEEARGAHRFLLSRPQSQISKLSLDHTLNAYFDTTYLCDPMQTKKGKQDDDDWEAPFKGKTPTVEARAMNTGSAYALETNTETKEDQEPTFTADPPSPPDQASAETSPKVSPISSPRASPVSSTSDFTEPSLRRSPSPTPPPPVVIPDVASLMQRPIKKAEVVQKPKISTNAFQSQNAAKLPVYNKYPISYINKKETSKPPVTLNTWENRRNDGYSSNEILWPEATTDAYQKGRNAIDEMRERSAEGTKDGAPFNFQGMLRKTNYSRKRLTDPEPVCSSTTSSSPRSASPSLPPEYLFRRAPSSTPYEPPDTPVPPFDHLDQDFEFVGGEDLVAETDEAML